MNYKADWGNEMQAVRPVKMIETSILACALFALMGCETPPSAVEQDFGSSVRNTIALQTMQPGMDAPSLDGEKAEEVLNVYRADVVKPEQKRDFIQINLGQ